MKYVLKLKGREILDLLIEFSYLAVIFIVPLYFSIIFPTYNIFELSKLSVFKIFVWLLFFLTTIKLFFYPVKWPFSFSERKDYYRVFKKYLAVPLIFIIGLGITLFFSINPQQSFFGSYDRQAGYLSSLFYFFWFILVVFNILTINNRPSQKSSEDNLTKKIDRVVVVASLSGFIVAVYGILQILGIDFLSWPENPLLTKRTFSTFGQPNFLASWLLLVIPLSAYLIYKNKKVLLRFFYSLIFLAQIACLFFTSSRGGLVAFGLVGLIFIVYLIFFTNLKTSKKLLASLGLLVVAIAGIWGLNNLLPGRLNSLLDLKSGSLAARVNFYSAAADAITKKPIFGYGLENGGEVFINYYQQNWGVYGNVSSTTDKAHNLILDIVLASGFFGLIFYIILYYYFFRLAGDNIRHQKMGALSLALSLGGAAYLISLMFSFGIVVGEVYFWLYFALIVAINNPSFEMKIPEIEAPKKDGNFLKGLLFSLVVLSSGWGVYYEFKVLEADHYFNALYYTLAEEQYFTALLLSDYIDNTDANPVNQKYYNWFLSDKLSDFYPRIKELSSKKVVIEKLTALDQKLEAKGYMNILAKGKINSVLGNYPAAEKYFYAVANQTPYWPETYLELGNLLVKEGKIKEAILNYQLVENILPDINDSRLNAPHRQIVQTYRKKIFRKLGNIYFGEGNYIEAEKYYQLAYVNDYNDFTLFKDIADTYYLRGDFVKALEYNLRGLKRNPKDYNWYLGAAMIYKEMGDKQEAKNYFDSAFKLAPTNEVLLKLKPEY